MTWKSETWGSLTTNAMIAKIKEQVFLRATLGAEYRICTDSQVVSERRIMGIDGRGKPVRRRIPVVRFNAVLTVLYKGKGGMVKGEGYECVTKGDNTAALQAADRLTKLGTRRPAIDSESLCDIATWLQKQIEASDTEFQRRS